MAITRVQSNSGFVSGGTSKAVAFGSNNTAGNVLIAFVLGTSGVVNTISDSQVNTWTSCGADETVATHGRLSAWYVQNCKAGANTVTGGNANGSDVHVHIYEISGLAASLQLDARGVNTGTAATGTVTTAGSVAQSTEYALACFTDWDNNRTLVAGAGYTIRQQTNNTTTGDAMASEDGNSTTGLSGTQTATMTGYPGTDTWLAYLVTFKGSVAAANTDPPFTVTVQPIINYGNMIITV